MRGILFLVDRGALGVVVGRPRDLSREQLKEARLQTAWRGKTNQDIAASIVGYIRQAALGEALIPFGQRVEQAMTRIYALAPWTPLQRKWLERIAKQLQHETIIDQEFINRAFATDGGAKRLDRILGGQLGTVLDQLADGLWPAA